MTTSVLIPSLFGVSLAFLFVAPASPANASAPPGFKAEILYHYREVISDGDAGEKRVSSPSIKREELLLGQRKNKSGNAKLVFFARPKHLPFEIQIQMTATAQLTKVRVTLLDMKTHRVIVGFPQTLEGPRSGEALTVELPLSSQQKTTLAQRIFDEGEILTYVSLSVMTSE